MLILRIIKKGIDLKSIFTYFRKNSALFISVILLLLILYVALFSRISAIDKALPYPGHVDEPTLVRTSLGMLKTGDFNPHFFKYPSLPIYLTFFNMSLGMLQSASKGEVKKTNQIGRMTYPYFLHYRLIRLPKYFFALLSVLSMLFMTMTGFATVKNKCLLLFIPAILSTSAVFFYFSHQYLNVDIIGCFFICALVAFQSINIKKDTIFYKAVIPGIITGLAIASKYNLFLLILPSILVILLFSKKKVFSLIVLIAVMALIFVAVVPYSILDFTTFFNDMCDEATHYGTVKTGIYSGVPGWDQFTYYYSLLSKDFGSLGMVLAMVGIVGLFIYDIRKALILCSFPLVFLFYMSTQAVHFVRNIVSLFAFVSLFAGFGIICITSLLYYGGKAMYRLFRKTAFVTTRRVLSLIFKQKWISIRLCMLVLCILLFPFGCICTNSRHINSFADQKAMDKIFLFSRIGTNLDIPADSRTRGEAWIFENIKEGTTIIIPEELYMDLRKLKLIYNIVVLKYKDKMYTKNLFIQKIRQYKDPYIIMPVFGFDKRFPHRKKYSDRINSFSQGLVTIKNFYTPPPDFSEYFPGDDRKVLYAYTYGVPSGSPLFSICKLKK